MTSTISFFKVVRAERKQIGWLAALQTILFFLVIPFRILLVMSLAASDQGGALPLIEVLETNIGLGEDETFVLILILGAAAAVCTFSYLHSMQKLDFYHSLPIRREQLFAVKTLAGFWAFVVPYAAAQLIGLVIGLFYGAANMQICGEVFLSILKGILFFLCSYSASLLAVMLTGKMLTTLLALFAFALYGPLLFLLVYYFIGVFLTSLEGLFLFYEDVTAVLRFTSPWAYCILMKRGMAAEGMIGLTGTIPTVGQLCQLIALTSVLMFLSIRIYRHRESESAGNALAFHRTEGAIKILIGIPVSLIAAILAESFFESWFWDLIFLVLSGGLFCMLMEFIYRWDIRQALMHQWHILITVILSAALFFSFRGDLLGINTYLPKMEEVESMALQGVKSEYVYLPAQVREFPERKNRDRKSILDYLETDRVDLIYPLAENGVERLLREEEMITAADPDTYVQIKYHLKNGKEIYRTYPVDEALYISCMEKLLQDETMKEKYYPMLNWNEEDLVSAFAADNYYSTEEREETDLYESGDAYDGNWINIPKEELGDFLAAYQQDLKELDFTQIYQAESSLYIVLRDRPATSDDENLYPVGRSFTRTTELLEQILSNE